MTPIRVTPPAGPVVPLPDLKAHLRVVGNHDDVHIAALEAAAVAHLDGWRGALGRCILEQAWQVSYPGAGVWRLPFPDVTAVTAVDGAGDPVDAALSHDALGSRVEIGEAAVVTLTAALPDDALPAIDVAIKLLVQHWYDNGTAVVTGTIATELPLAFSALIGPLRWIRV
ncbi:head-tail connector protein [Roseinatronobacter bogoriensis]|uniref:head-tail connector protein n=1 Tax=Roseinatronobacter bogoriensis TaxID=119542 RepID=UPI0010E79C1C|nr:head-tail connector protein [Rhodobaca bogoriensis]MBB4207278.1 putative phiE125 gp8 family phage protein [Rhodobaca bogoriensis DSM 18756]TDY65777.1 putative phiE125 gp8 family phage protein [Rhodobaca bogoriensis DSM 18756]